MKLSIAKRPAVVIDGIVRAEEQIMRDNDGSLILMQGAPDTDEYERVGSIAMTVKAKRGEAYRTHDPAQVARAEEIVLSVNCFDGFVTALQRIACLTDVNADEAPTIARTALIEAMIEVHRP